MQYNYTECISSYAPSRVQAGAVAPGAASRCVTRIHRSPTEHKTRKGYRPSSLPCIGVARERSRNMPFALYIVTLCGEIALNMMLTRLNPMAES